MMFADGEETFAKTVNDIEIIRNLSHSLNKTDRRLLLIILHRLR